MRNAKVRGAQLGVGATTIDGRTHHATDKPYVERFFGTMQWDLLNFLPGYAGSRPGELPGYNPVAEAGLTPDELYGVITRYMVDEYPFKPHNGTGMFGATPRQKLAEVIQAYGEIKAPSARDRRLHLGLKAECSVTSEGVLFKGVPYNSGELQRFMDSRNDKRVTVHVDPDYPGLASITLEGHPGEITAKLRMTALKDLTLDEIFDVMAGAVESNPQRRQLDDAALKAARARRARENGFFTPSNDPSTYNRLDKLQKQADTLLGVECVNVGRPLDTVPPGQIMSRNRVGWAAIDQRTNTRAITDATTTESKPPSPLFSPIKESKF